MCPIALSLMASPGSPSWYLQDLPAAQCTWGDARAVEHLGPITQLTQTVLLSCSLRQLFSGLAHGAKHAHLSASRHSCLPEYLESFTESKERSWEEEPLGDIIKDKNMPRPGLWQPGNREPGNCLCFQNCAACIQVVPNAVSKFLTGDNLKVM